MLEVWLDATRDELERFWVLASDEEVWDDDLNDFVPITDPTDAEEFEWYAIPAEVVNAQGKVRQVLVDERHRLMVVGVDEDE